jgi:hypothetical protein
MASRAESSVVCEDLLGVVLHPAGLREVLREFALTATHHAAVGRDDERARTGGALIESEDVAHVDSDRWWKVNGIGREHERVQETPAVGDDARDQRMRRDVERRIVHRDALGATRVPATW